MTDSKTDNGQSGAGLKHVASEALLAALHEAQACLMEVMDLLVDINGHDVIVGREESWKRWEIAANKELSTNSSVGS